MDTLATSTLIFLDTSKYGLTYVGNITTFPKIAMLTDVSARNFCQWSDVATCFSETHPFTSAV